MNENKLSMLLKAVSDATRRSLLTVLCQQGKTRVTDLARIYDLSLNAVSKHIKVLEKAGLVRRETIGRTHWIAADLTQTTEIEEWFRSLKSIWELRLDHFDELMTGGEKNNE
ncbi:MAG: metalloregulator ArsR/SmtB family transcription factor [Gammaproteobacteria bacterium]|jgi:DNA-binding transcriptional ArsR family regulator|nr:metalloregulator ArsR/SmtB family transcription factor [Gammaproteobacteria bacterium]